MVTYIIYKTKNLINGKYYIGKHTNRGIDYLGSGRAIKSAISKYGKENFKREILFEFETEYEAYLKEKEIVTNEIVNDQMSYNLKTGGDGGIRMSTETRHKMSESAKGKSKSEEHKRKIGLAHKGKTVNDGTREKLRQANLGKKKSKEFCKKRSNLMKGENNPMYGQGFKVAGKNNPMYGKKHTEETRRKISEKGSGQKHSQYGSIWITNGKESRKIKKEKIIPNGWRRGRK